MKDKLEYNNKTYWSLRTYLYRATPLWAAPALHTAKETPRIALAPSLDLFSVPSSASMKLSMVTWSATWKLSFKRAGAMT